MVPTINELVTILTRGYSPGYVMTGCPGHQLSPLLYKAGNCQTSVLHRLID
ncbi:MAG: hypothetical protein AAB433_15915 [Nitrospirota bacterium]